MIDSPAMSLPLTKEQSGHLTRCVSSLGNEEFASSLLAFVDAVVSFDSAVLMAYPGDATLRVLHDQLAEGDRDGRLFFRVSSQF